jgi:hypothetical protein
MRMGRSRLGLAHPISTQSANGYLGTYGLWAFAAATRANPTLFFLLSDLLVLIQIVRNASVRAPIILLTSVRALRISAFTSHVAPVTIVVYTTIRVADEISIFLSAANPQFVKCS